jgi:hypothetical protein
MNAVDVPPPGVGFTTVTSTVPAVVTSAAEIMAVTCELLTTVVLLAEPFHCTVAPEAKFDPFTKRVKPDEAAVATAGAKLLMTGNGFDGNAVTDRRHRIASVCGGVRILTIRLHLRRVRRFLPSVPASSSP